MRKAIATRPAEFRKLVATLKKNGLELETEGRMKRTPRGFEQVDGRRSRRGRPQPAFLSSSTSSIRPESTTPALVDELVDFTMRAKPLLDWGRAIQGKVPRS